MPLNCFSRVPAKVRTPRCVCRRTSLPFLLTGLALLLSFQPASAAERPYSGFQIDLRDVSRLYDSLARDRFSNEIVDSTVAFDWERVRLGNQRYRVKTFLPTDFSTTREVTDYTVIPGYRARFTVPRASFFEPTLQDVGSLTFTQPRDYSIPGLSIELTPTEAVTDEIVRESREAVWKDVARQRIMLAPTPGEAAAGGIKFDIPLPMPKSLESIFGPGDKTSITVRGREEITIAGETTVTEPFIGIEGRENQSLFPSLDMQQKLDVSLTGTIGDKVSIQVDHSSEAIGDNANRVRLAYNGYEDEVIKLIELGNTSLSLPGSQLVSVATGAQGLFGIKMLAKTGSTDFTVIASKQEGEVSSAQFTPSGGALGQAETRTIRDVDYVKNKYFYFDDPVRHGGFLGPSEEGLEVYRTVTPQDLVINPSIVRFPGWVVPDSIGDGSQILAAVAVLNAGGTATAAGALDQDFELLTLGEDYAFITDTSNNLVGLELFDPIPTAALKAIGVSYENTLNQPVGGTYGSLGGTNPALANLLMLKMLKAPDPNPLGVFGSTWPLMIRYFYNLGLTNIDVNSLKISIEEVNTPRLDPTRPDSSDVSFLRIFGLDQHGRAGTGAPDEFVDLKFVDVTTGLLQFPVIEGFAPPHDSVDVWTLGEFSFEDSLYAAKYRNSQRIYRDLLNPTTEQDVHQYQIKVSAVSTSREFRINALNIVEFSEVIKIGGDILSRGTDYEIDYESGLVTLKEPGLAKLTPNAQVHIDYQFKPIGGLGSSTLAGISSVSKIGDNARFGTTFLYESRSTSDAKPRLGEEPSRALVGGLTGAYEHQSRLLTDLANLLPFVDSDVPSTINLDGEIAASLPNPNTKNEAYIDDFEGTEDTDRITLSRRAWYPASLPIDPATGVVKPDTLPSGESSQLDLIWYNIEAEHGVHRRDLNPELDQKENTLVQSLDIDLDATPDPAEPVPYAGLMLGFPQGGLDITQGQFIEIWINDFKPDVTSRGGTLHIDLGVIDENFYNPGLADFDDEDKNRDGFAAAFDDTGLDGLFNTEGTPNEGATESNPDPSGDDLDLSRFPSGRYEKVNGTEGNVYYDTEDLDRNQQMTRDNAYFSYEINLADSAEIDIRALYTGDPRFEEQIAKSGHENDSWRLYRVPLPDHVIVSPSGLPPRLDEIRHVRIWFDDAADVLRTEAGTGRNRLQITEFSIKGNRWEADGVRDLADQIDETSTAQFAIGTISTKTDPGVYHPPIEPNVQNEVADKESSLALRYEFLETGRQVRILKRFQGQGLDMTLYRDLNFWVHTDSLRAGLLYYLRLGTNEANFYEVQVPFTSEHYNETGWARVIIKTADITGLKFLVPDSTFVSGTARDVADPDRVYPIRMVGAPSLQSVRFLYAGVRNVSNPNPQSGEVWLNDIFSGDVLRDFDHAERLSANVSLAGGALSVGGNWARTGADYRGLRQTRGAGADNTVLSLNGRTDLQYFLPLGGFSVPISVGYSRNRSLPKFPPNSDTEIVDEVLSDSLRTESNTRSFSTSLARRTVSKNFLMRYTFDALRPNFTYSNSRSISPATRDTTTTMGGSLSYTLNWTGQKTLPLFGKNRIRWWPNSIDINSTAARSQGDSWSYRNGEFRKNPELYAAELRNQGNVRYNPFRSIETSFGISVVRDLAIPRDWHGINVGTELGRSNNLRVSLVPPRTWIGVSIFEPSVEVQSSYNEDSSPNVRREGDPPWVVNSNASRTDSGRMRFDIGRHLGNVFRWVGVDVSTPSNGPRSPGSVGGAPQDTTGAPRAPAPPDTTKAKPKPGAGTAVRGLARMLTGIRPISANIQHRVSSSYVRLPERPDLAYQLGFTTDAGVVGLTGPEPDNKRRNLRFNLDSGVQLTEHFDVQGRFTRETTDTDFRLNHTRTLAVTWPDIQAKWDGLGQFRPLRPILESGSINLNYRESHAENGQRDQEPTTKSGTFSLSPAVDMGWKNKLQTTLSVSYSSNTNENTRGSSSKTTSSAGTITLKRDFTGGGGIGLFGKKMSWNNNLETNLAIAYSRSGGERLLGGITEPIPASTSWSVSPNARYTFSKNVNGSAFIDYSRSFTESTKQTTTSLRIGVTAVITF